MRLDRDVATRAAAGILITCAALFGSESVQAPGRTLNTDWKDAIATGADEIVVDPSRDGVAGNQYNLNITLPSEITSQPGVGEVSYARSASLRQNGQFVCDVGLALPDGVRAIVLSNGEIYTGDRAIIIPGGPDGRAVAGITANTFVYTEDGFIYIIVAFPVDNPKENRTDYYYIILGEPLRAEPA